MRRTLLVLVAVLAVATVSLAQDAPILLRYKYTVGQTDTYVMRTTGTLPVSINPGPETGIPAMDFDTVLDMNMTMRYVCKSVAADGSAQAEMTLPALTAKMSIAVAQQPMDLVLTWEKGQLTSTVNGQPQPPDENIKKLTQALSSTMRYTLKPTGEQIPDPETVKLMNQLYSASAFSGLDLSRLSALTSRLPADPVAPGATWKVEDQVENKEAGLSGRSEMKFVGYEDLEGVRTVKIEGQAAMEMHGMGQSTTGPMGMTMNLTKLETNVNFVNYLDPVKGVTVLSRMAMAQNMLMVISMTGLGGAAPIHLPTSIQNGQLTIEMKPEPPQPPQPPQQ